MPVSQLAKSTKPLPTEKTKTNKKYIFNLQACLFTKSDKEINAKLEVTVEKVMKEKKILVMSN